MSTEFTNEDLQKHLNTDKFITGGYIYKKQAQRIKCADGFTVSIQASEMHYCDPRDNKGPYVSVELGYPTQEEPLIIDFAEEMEKPTQTVYGYVDVGIVVAMVNKHGGVQHESI